MGIVATYHWLSPHTKTTDGGKQHLRTPQNKKDGSLCMGEVEHPMTGDFDTERCCRRLPQWMCNGKWNDVFHQRLTRDSLTERDWSASDAQAELGRAKNST